MPINEGCWKMNTTILIVLHDTISLAVSTSGKPIPWSKYLFSNLCRGKSVIPLIMSCPNRTSDLKKWESLLGVPWSGKSQCQCTRGTTWMSKLTKISIKNWTWIARPLPRVLLWKHRSWGIANGEDLVGSIIIIQLTHSAIIWVNIVHDFPDIGWNANLELINKRDGERLTRGTLHLSRVLTLYHVEYFEVYRALNGIEHLNTPQINAIQISQLASPQHTVLNSKARKKRVQPSHKLVPLCKISSYPATTK